MRPRLATNCEVNASASSRRSAVGEKVRRPLRGIIVDGPDCTGKTTLIKRLKSRLSGGGWDVMQMGHRDGDQFKRYMSVYLDADRLLLDRSHFSEIVYGDLWRNGRHFAACERLVLDRVAREEFITVLCTAPPAVLFERYMAKDYAQRPMTREDIESAQMRFVETVTPHSAFVFDTHPLELFSFDMAALSILERIESARNRQTVKDAMPSDECNGLDSSS